MVENPIAVPISCHFYSRCRGGVMFVRFSVYHSADCYGVGILCAVMFRHSSCFFFYGFVKEFSPFYENLFDRNIFARSAATSLVLVWPFLCFDVKISYVSILCNIRDVLINWKCRFKFSWRNERLRHIHSYHRLFALLLTPLKLFLLLAVVVDVIYAEHKKGQKD